MIKIKNKNFFKVNTISLAQNLIGKWIETNINGVKVREQILETEAYLGVNDSACHTFNNKRTLRTEPMYHEGGTIYIYLCYGMHYLLNIVSEKEGVPEAVLIRATTCAKGPARLTKHLNITKNLNGESIVNNNKICILDDGKKYAYTCASRIGISYANKIDQEAPLRFILKKD